MSDDVHDETGRRLFSRYKLSAEFGLPRERVTAALANTPPDGHVQGGRHPAWLLTTAISVLFNIRERRLWTRAALAREFGLSTRRVELLLADVEPDGHVQDGRHPAWYLTSFAPLFAAHQRKYV